jgi:hypothetical protein
MVHTIFTDEGSVQVLWAEWRARARVHEVARLPADVGLKDLFQSDDAGRVADGCEGLLDQCLCRCCSSVQHVSLEGQLPQGHLRW